MYCDAVFYPTGLSGQSGNEDAARNSRMIHRQQRQSVKQGLSQTIELAFKALQPFLSLEPPAFAPESP